MHYLYRYVCILNVFFICVYGQLSAIKNLLLYYYSSCKKRNHIIEKFKSYVFKHAYGIMIFDVKRYKY